MKTLVKHDGSKTAVLEAVWDVFRTGGMVGGTSAGAAIMSEAMIGGGNSIGGLIVALMHEKPRFLLGFGTDENTALIYLGSQNLIRVVGAAGVTIINATDATISYVQNLPKIENLSVSYLNEGDSYNFITGVITPAANKKPTRGKEYYKVQNPGQAGILSAYSNSFLDLITVNLIDNKSTDTIRNISFYDQYTGFQVTLCKTPLNNKK